MNARLRTLQRHGRIGAALFAFLAIASLMSMIVGEHFLAWSFAPFAAGAFGFALRTVAMVNQAREQADREADERAQAAARREQLRRQLHSLKAPDADDGQRPVCGLEDLGALTEEDTFLEQPGSRFLRVVPYGKHRAHQECAELVPYKPTAAERMLAGHEADHHGAPWTRLPGCSACAQEIRERIADDPEVGRPIWPPLGLTAAECVERLSAAFGVPPMQLDDPSERAMRARFDQLVSSDQVRLRLKLPVITSAKDFPTISSMKGY